MGWVELVANHYPAIGVRYDQSGWEFKLLNVDLTLSQTFHLRNSVVLWFYYMKYLLHLDSTHPASSR